MKADIPSLTEIEQMVRRVLAEILAQSSSPNLSDEDETVDTPEAARRLGRSVSCLRRWSCLDDGPIRPIHVNGARGALRWKVSDINTVLRGEKVK